MLVRRGEDTHRRREPCVVGGRDWSDSFKGNVILKSNVTERNSKDTDCQGLLAEATRGKKASPLRFQRELAP